MQPTPVSNAAQESPFVQKALSLSIRALLRFGLRLLSNSLYETLHTGCVENELGLREWLESKGHKYIVTGRLVLVKMKISHATFSASCDDDYSSVFCFWQDLNPNNVSITYYGTQTQRRELTATLTSIYLRPMLSSPPLSTQGTSMQSALQRHPS